MRINFIVSFLNRLISAGTEESCIALYNRQFSTNIKKNHKINTSFISPGFSVSRSTKTAFNLKFQYLLRCDKKTFLKSLETYNNHLIFRINHTYILLYLIVSFIVKTKKILGNFFQRKNDSALRKIIILKRSTSILQNRIGG